MPVRRKYTKRRKFLRKRKTNYRRRYNKGSVVMTKIPKVAGPFPDQYRCVFKYAANLYFNTTNGSHLFSMNSLFDPDVSATGGQPVWYDQLVSADGPYLSYRVLASRIRCTFVPDGATVPTFISITPTDSANGPFGATPADLTANSRVRWAILNEGVSTTAKTLTQYATVAQVSGVKKSVVQNDNNFQALYNAAPADQTYWLLQLNAMDATTACSVRVIVQVEYYAQLADRPRLQSIN